MRKFLVVVGIMMGGALLQAQAKQIAGQQRAVLVELFTSEGCSSCPPADALLRELEGKHSAEGDLIVGISEHVTYWNNLGWRDPYSTDVMTERQRAYGDRFRIDGVYTPQMVVNGEDQLVGSDRGGVVRALKQVHHAEGASIMIAGAVVENGAVAVTYRAAGDASLREADLYAVIAEDAVVSRVLRGENAGRTLSHVAVAKSLVQVGKVHVGEAQSLRVMLPSAGAKQGSPTRHLILFVQTSGLGPVLAVATVPLQSGADVRASR